MKKSIISLGLIVLASCTLQEKDINVDGDGNDILQAGLESVEDGRITLKDGTDVVWSDGDVISVVGSASTDFTLSGGSGTAEGTFSGDISKAGKEPYFAVFPRSGNASFDGSAVTFDIAQNRGAEDGNIKADVLPMISDVKNGVLQFHNIFGLLKVSLKSNKAVTIKKMTLHDLGGNMLWGRCTVPVGDGTAEYDGISLAGGNNTTSLIWEKGTEITSTAKSFYFCVPPGALDRGFSIVLYQYDSSVEGNTGKAYTFLQKVSSPVAAQRSVIININTSTISEKSEPLNTKERGYYKTLFVDGGIGLTHSVDVDSLPWIKAMGLENDYEFISVSNLMERDSLTQLGLMLASPSGNDATWEDENGVLLYPDGEPRFRTMYVNGGNSIRHGQSLSQNGRDRVHAFYTNGGSYVASCAGAFLACKYVDGTNSYDNATESENFTYGIFPGNLVHTSMPVSITKYGPVYSAIKAETDFKDFAKGDTIDLVCHHGGGYLPYAYNYQLKVQPERLFSYQYTGDPKAETDTTLYTYHNLMTYANFARRKNKVDSTCIWAYKNINTTGRAVLCGSHPESSYAPSQIRLMVNMLDYAMEGNGAVTLKANLELGVEREMNALWSEGTPDFARIGDRQYHHFKLVTNRDIENFRLTLNSNYSSDSGINLYLSLRKGGAAWISDADYVLCSQGSRKVLTIKNLPAGTWYVGVYCPTTVTAVKQTPTSYLKFYKYSGKTQTLNGIAYSIKAESLGETDISLQDYSGEMISFNNGKLDD